jgi:branched-chain amino acid transport system permease protein
MVQFAKSLLPIAIGFAIAALMYFVLPDVRRGYYSRIILDIGIAMILAVSLNIVSGMTGQFSIGHAGFMVLGGYTAAFITYYTSLAVWGSNATQNGPVGWLLFAAACLVGGVVAAIAGYLVGLPSLRLRGDYLAIVTLGFGEILRVLLTQTDSVIRSAKDLQAATASQFFPPPVGGSQGFTGVPKYTNLIWVYAVLTVTVVAAFRLKRSGFGRAMIAVREDEVAAQAMGVNVARTKVMAFVLAAFFAGVGGGLYAHEFGLSISPEDAGFQRSFEYLIMTVLGGRGSISGVMLAAGLLMALPELLRDVAEYRLIVYALLLIGMMLVRPQGLFGTKEIWDFFVPRSLRKSSPPEGRA